MAAPLDPAAAPAGPSVDADAISNRTFATSFRGWDPDEVRVHLVAVAESVRALLQHQDDLERRLVEANAAARRANTAELDVDEVAKILGEETARVLSAAREAAAEMQDKAQERVAELIARATEDASGVRAAATEEATEIRHRAAEEAAATRRAGEEHVAGWRAEAEAEVEARREVMEGEVAEHRQAAREEAALVRAEADEAAARVREEADEAAERVREQADAYDAKVRTDADVYSERVRAEADAEVARITAAAVAEAARTVDEATLTATEHRHAAEAELAEARARATALVDEAQVVRERVLADLSKRRKAARQHLEQLRAARDRLLSAYEVVRGTVDEATTELAVVLPEAKVAADEAARRVAAEPDTTVEQLEAEIAMAHDAGLPLVADVTPVGDAADEARARVAAAASGAAGSMATAEVDEATSDGGVEVGADEDAAVGAEVAEDAGVEEAGVEAVVAEDEARPVEALVDDEVLAAQDSPVVAAPVPPPPTTVDLRALHEGRQRRRGLLRRGRSSIEDELQGGKMDAVEVSAEFEVVRVIDTGEVPAVETEAAPADVVPEAGPADEEAATEPEADAVEATPVGAPAPSVDEEPVDRVHEVEADTAAVEALATEEAAAAGGDEPPEAVGPGEVPEPPGEVPEPPGEAPEVTAEESAGPAGDEAAPDVDALFARLRAERSGEESGAAGQDASGVGPRAEDEEPAPEAEEPPAAAGGADPVAGGKATEREAAEEQGIDPEAAEAAALLERRDGILAEIEQRLAKRLKRALSDEQSALLDALRRTRKRPGLDDVLPAVDDQVAAYTAAAVDEVRSAVVAGVRFAGDVEDRAVVSTDTDVDALARQVAEAFALPLRQRVVRALSDGPAGEDDEAADPVDELELADRIRACYREWRSQRLGDVVADGVLGAFSRGMFDAMPSGCGLRWLVDPAVAPCPDAEDNALAGTVAKGGQFPTGHVCPPAHAGCRCMVLPEAMVTDKGVKVARPAGSRR